MGASRFFGLDAIEWSVTLTGSVPDRVDDVGRPRGRCLLFQMARDGAE
jgi:hypothetical protein